MGNTSSTDPILHYQQDKVVGEIVLNYKSAEVVGARVFRDGEQDTDGPSNAVRVNAAFSEVSSDVQRFVHEHCDTSHKGEIELHRRILALSKEHEECSVMRNELRNMMQVHGKNIVEAMDMYIYLYYTSKPLLYLPYRRRALSELNKMLEKIHTLQVAVAKREMKLSGLYLFTFVRGILDLLSSLITSSEVVFVHKFIRYRVKELQEIEFLKRMVSHVNTELQEIRRPATALLSELNSADPLLTDTDSFGHWVLKRVIDSNRELKCLLDEYDITWKCVRQEAEAVQLEDDKRSKAQIEGRLSDMEYERVREEEEREKLSQFRMKWEGDMQYFKLF